MPGEFSVEVHPYILDVFCLGELNFMWTGGQVSLRVVNVMEVTLDSLA
jgi:hypothetical protein